MITKPADDIQFNVGQNASRRDLVLVAIGTGMANYNITPDRADDLAKALLDAAAAARRTG
jgi:hypothetical protein